MRERVTAYIEQHALLSERGTVVVAVSGGADSLCLMHLLYTVCGRGKRYPDVDLHVAHLNHQLRGAESDQEAIQVARLAQSWDLPYTIGTTDVPALAQQERRSLEDAARQARYRFLREVAQGQRIAVAHHQDDAVETLVLHWIRGGGIDSLVGLQPHQQDIIRPLLAVTHAETLAYCMQHGLTPIEDASNNDTRFYRNRIRHELLPLIETMNPNFRSTLLRNANVLRVDAEWIDVQVEQAWLSVVLEEQDTHLRLSIPHFQALALSIGRHLLRRAASVLSAGQSPLELRHYELIEALLQREGKVGNVALDMPDGIIVRREHDTLLLRRQGKAESLEVFPGIEQPIVLSVPGSAHLRGTPWTVYAETLPEETVDTVRALVQRRKWQQVWQMLPATNDIVYLDAGYVGSPLHVRTRRPGDTMRPLGMAHEKKIQDILVNKHIPRQQRDMLPLFFNGDGYPVWLGSVCVDERARITEHTQGIVCLKLIKE